jgi:hypothetical protein
VPADALKVMAHRPFQYINLAMVKQPWIRDREARRKAAAAFNRKLLRKDLVLLGDSQLHSAVYGSRLPEFIMAAVGGKFRWGSKSFSGFSPPDIYREVVGAGEPPRVVVLAFLPKYFWNDGHEDSYRPRPMPAVAARPAPPADAPRKPFFATVRVVEVSRQRDPRGLEYDEALTQTAAVVVKGPLGLLGKTIAVRYWTMWARERIAAAGAVRKGQVLALTLRDWYEVIEKDGKLAEHMIFNDTSLPTDAPTYWVTAGPLAPDKLLPRGGE